VDAVAGEKGGDRGVEELGSVVGLHGNYAKVELGLGVGDEVENSGGGVGFVAEGKRPHKMRIFINNDKVVFNARDTKNGRSPQITMN
jgi:hypothetical protein